MKKNFMFAMMGAIALTGAVGLTSCSDSEDVVQNPNYNPETNEVYTQFVFNVSTGNTATTRQTSDATQALESSPFRGIDKAQIMCFKQASDGQYLKAAATADKSFDMALVAAPATLSNTASRRVLEMSLPLNTNTMLFYGKAVIDDNQENTHGHLDAYNVTNNLSETYFQLGRCLKATDATKLAEVESLFAAALTCVMNVNRGNAAISADDHPSGSETVGEVTTTVPKYGFDLPADLKPNLTWGELAANTTGKSLIETTKDISPLETKLMNVYKQMTSIQTAELRNGSGHGLVATITSLWTIINSVRCATPTSQREAYAKYMAELISEELKEYFNYGTLPIDGASVSGVSIKPVSNLTTALSADTYWPTSTAGAKPSSFDNISSLTSANLLAFPELFNLPQGATHYKFDSTKKAFYYPAEFDASAVGGTSFTVNDYYYPSELLYFGNSPLRVSDTEHAVSAYPSNTTAWNVADWTGWEADSHVKSSTRSVAMKNDINYGTSLLKTTLGYAADIVNGSKKLKDNNKFIQNRDNNVDEANKEITPTKTSFILKSILIGGQSPKVGWDYLPLPLGTGEKQGYIYDKAITNSGAVPLASATGIEGTSEPNYTLVFDNFKGDGSGGAAATQDKVYVALEIMNNTGQDFFGKDNLIANGTNFYLIGELDPSGKTINSWPDYHALPPYIYSGGAQTRVPRVFIQDYMTTANFKIGEWSLQYAYLTVPDLRSSSVTLGLSVDLNWSTGINFNDVVIGGNTETQISTPTP